MTITDKTSFNDTSELDAIIIGAGFSGLYALHHLRDELGLNVRCYEAASGVGGTWWYNRYPGARVDAPTSPFYGYLFSQRLADDWTWTETRSDGPTILSYLEFVAERLDLKKDIKFDTWVSDARYDEENQRWSITTAKGGTASAQFLISATGVVFVTNLPDYKGIDDFAGDIYHTGRWPHEEVSLKGKRVGVIGTGSSGVQVIPEIAKEADHVTVFQRTAQYALPGRNRLLTDEEKRETRDNREYYRDMMRNEGGFPFRLGRLRASDHTPEERRARYEELWAQGGYALMLGSCAGVMADRELNEEISAFVRSKIRGLIDDPATAEKLMPKYLFGTKRLILDNGYFETFNRQNVSLVDLREDPIVEFTPSTVRTEQGKHPIDVLVLATGYDAVTGSMLKLNPKGRGGISLKQKWQDRFESYLGVTIPGFPNLFAIHGPGSPGVFFTVPLGSELTTEWIGGCIRHMRDNKLRVAEATQEAATAWGQEIDTIAGKTLFPLTDSWYTGANVKGKKRQFLGHPVGTLYYRRLFGVAEDGYEGIKFLPAHHVERAT